MIDSNVAVKLTPSKNQLAKTACNVHKFGGSSLATAACIERVVDIIRQHCQLNDIIVVSANGDTTDALFSIYQIAIELDEVKPLLKAHLQELFGWQDTAGLESPDIC